VDFINKLRQKPRRVRKQILWTTIIILGLILVALWIYNIYTSIEKLKSENIIEDLNLLDFKEKLPKIEMPE